MCGIFGYVGSRSDAGLLASEGLKNLEYRGYDSWGIAWRGVDTLCIEKQVGKISDVDSFSFREPSSLSIGHTRWATHGGVTTENAHPHVSCTSDIAVVHNGIIENHKALKSDLLSKGHSFVSDTDTEIIPHLIEEEMKQTNDFGSAVRESSQKLFGRYAILALHRDSQTLVAARNGSPLIVGIGDDGFFIASDIPAFLDHTNTVAYLDDGQMVVTDGESILFTDIETGEETPKRHVQITWSKEEAQKGDFDHFMLKEIMDQKDSIARAVNQDEHEILTLAEAIRNAQGTFLAGSGTAHKSCMAAEYFFSVIAAHHVNTASACEFKLYHHFLQPESLLIVVTQSGETADVLEAMKIAKSKGAKVLSIVNAQGSTVERASDYALHINAGPEIAVASTKALTGQMAVLLLIAYALADNLQEGRRLLLESASKITDMLNPRYVERISLLAEHIKDKSDIYIIGRSWHYPMALESAIKIKEVSYIHAEGFAGGELKHGPIALIEEDTPCIVLMGNDEVKDDILLNASELKSRGAHIIGVSPHNEDVFDEWIKVPEAGAAQSIVNVIPMQVLSYFLALERGKDPDMPRNLAKSVTVK